MTRPRRASRLAAAAAGVWFALALIVASAGAQTPVVHYQRESFGAFERQLASGLISSAEFNKKAHSLHLLFKNGKYALVSYPSHEEPQIAAKLEGKGVPYTIEKTKTKAKAATHHTLRYIAGGIVVIVIVVVTVVLLIDRRRKLAEPGGAQPASSAGGDAP